MMTLARIAAAAARCSLVAALLLGTPVPVAASETIAYTYDGQGRLVKVARSGTVNNGTSECYAYDAAANRTNLNIATSAACSSAAPVSFSIASNGAVTEGTPSVFTITKTGTTSSTLSVSYQTANGTAVAPGDYTAKPLTAISFAPTDVTKTVSVTTATDALTEGNETFTMTLSAPTGGATITTGTATATISDPTCGGVSFSVASNAAVTEGTSSVFTVTKSGTASVSCGVSYATANLTATAGSDYTAASGPLTFTSAQTSKTVSVATTDDTTVESAETFKLTLSSPTGGAALGTPSSATATINDNDSTGTCSGVSFAVSNASAVEADNLTFTVTKTGSTTSSCSVTYATANGTAVAPGDYTAITATVLTFTSTQTSRQVLVGTNSNGVTAEPDETMFLNLSGATAGASISDNQGVGTITDDGATGCPLCRGTTAAPTSSDAPLSDPPASDPLPADATEPPPPGQS